MKKRKKIGLVLGGGAARGIAHIGVLKILDRAGIKIDNIIGVSIGAVIGAGYALGMSPEELEQEVLKFDSQFKMARLLDLTSLRKGVLQGEKIREYLDKLYGGREFKDTRLPIWMLAADLGTGREVILKSGNLADAARISISVPGIFTPVKVGKQYLIDGGVVNPTPIDLAKRQGCDIVIAVDITMKKNVRVVNPSMFFTVMQAYEIVRDQAVKQKTNWNSKNIVMVTPPTRGAADSFKFRDMKNFISSGAEAMEKAMPKLEKLL